MTSSNIQVVSRALQNYTGMGIATLNINPAPRNFCACPTADLLSPSHGANLLIAGICRRSPDPNIPLAWLYCSLNLE